MEETKINVTVPEGWKSEDTIKLEIREGKAEEIRTRKNWKIVGIISTVNEYVAKRKFNDDPKDNPEIVIFSANPDKPFISLIGDPHDELGSKFDVSTELIPNPELHAWGINRDVYFTQAEFKALIRKQAHNFADMKTAQALIKTMDNFVAKFETEVKKSDDRRGNDEESVKNAIKFSKGDAPQTVELNIPMFKGTDPIRIVLDVEIQRYKDTAQVEFGFYSLDLELTRREAAQKMIYNEISELRTKFVTIEQA